jgi:hypothetical protein
MQTLTIKQDSIKSLDSDESKLDFANSVIELLSDPKKSSSSEINEALSEGLNVDLPEPMEGAPDFDSSNMIAPEYKRYSRLKAGYVPKRLYCSYAEYEYKHLSELSQSEFDDKWKSVGVKIEHSKGQRDHVKFLEYLYEIYRWYFNNRLLPSVIR